MLTDCMSEKTPCYFHFSYLARGFLPLYGKSSADGYMPTLSFIMGKKETFEYSVWNLILV